MKHRFLLSVLTLAPIVVGCNEPAATTTSTPASAQTLVNLQQADALDGSEDHVIGKCYVCSLGMDGKKEFAVDVHGYTAHLCSEHCKDHFAQASSTVIANTKIPDTK